MGAYEVPSRGGRSLRIIHLSDLHFGKDHRFGGEKTPSGDFVEDGRSLAESIRADLENQADEAEAIQANLENQADEAEALQIVCITGDMTETASGAEFERALGFCKAICEGDMALGPLAVVPGNHDVDWTQPQSEREKRMKPWSHFLGDLRRTHDDWGEEDRDAIVRTDLVESHGVIIAEINSCAWVQQNTAETHRGRVSQKALRHLANQLAIIDPEVASSCIKIALLHHHPILIPDLAEPGRGYDSVLGAGYLLRILRQHGFHLLLHGHKHIPFTFTEDSLSGQESGRHDYPLFVVCGGSVASKSLPDDRPPVNCYNRIDIKWLPDARQYRCRVETRELVRSDNTGVKLMPSDWYWRELGRDDRSFRPERPIPASDLQAWRQFNTGDDDSRRKEQYALSRGVFPTVRVRPSLTPGQAHEALVELRDHIPRPVDLEPVEIRSVRWSAGSKHAVFELDAASAPRFHAAFDYYGPMLIQASVTWADGHAADMFIYAQLEEIEP
jgi:3',5'-cyclic AMP phosphodiesterase CpdA